jgi:hypothetical protein
LKLPERKVETAIAKLKRYKSPDSDQIQCHTLVSALACRLNQVRVARYGEKPTAL